MKVAFVGLGTMGQAMAGNILKAGYQITVFNRSKEREQPLAECGAQCAASPAQAAENADVILICVSDTPDVEQVILGKDGIMAGAKPCAVVVDTSTISPTATRQIAQKLSEKDIRMVDAPVSGGSEGATLGTLAIMVGGEVDDVEYVRPVLEAMGSTITHVGPIGSGQLTKAINQTIIAGVYWAVAEGMAQGLKAKLDMEKVIAAISGGAAGSWVLSNRAGFMIDNDYPLGFRLKLHRKDLSIALDAAQDLGVALPMASLVGQVENGLISRGYGDEDISAMARSLRETAGID